jgi:hypothetical protein
MAIETKDSYRGWERSVATTTYAQDLAIYDMDGTHAFIRTDSGTDYYLEFINIESDSVEWAILESNVNESPLDAKIADNYIFLAADNLNTTVFCLNKSDGSIAFQEDVSTQSEPTRKTQIYTEGDTGYVYYGDDGGSNSAELEKFDLSGAGANDWKTALGSDFFDQAIRVRSGVILAKTGSSSSGSFGQIDDQNGDVLSSYDYPSDFDTSWSFALSDSGRFAVPMGVGRSDGTDSVRVYDLNKATTAVDEHDYSLSEYETTACSYCPAHKCFYATGPNGFTAFDSKTGNLKGQSINSRGEILGVTNKTVIFAHSTSKDWLYFVAGNGAFANSFEKLDIFNFFPQDFAEGGGKVLFTRPGSTELALFEQSADEIKTFI